MQHRVCTCEGVGVLLSCRTVYNTGRQGSLVKCVGSCEEGQIWQRRLHNGDLAVGVFNLKDSESEGLCASWDELEVEADTVCQVQALVLDDCPPFLFKCSMLN